MALIKCHECGHQISKSAAACPNCGANNSTVLFIRDYAGFVGKAKASSVVRVELQLFKAGNHTMEFPTAGLQW